MLQAGKKQGIKTQKILLCGNCLFMIMEVSDECQAEDMNQPGGSEREKEWDDMMRQIQLLLEARKLGEWWAEIETVYDLDWYK